MRDVLTGEAMVRQEEENPLPKWLDEFNAIPWVESGGCDGCDGNYRMLQDIEAFIFSKLEEVINRIPDRLGEESYQATAEMVKQQLRKEYL